MKKQTMKTEEIKKIREYYGLKKTQMSVLCGFGINQWGNYEAGSLPSASNERLIFLLNYPKNFLKMTEFISEPDKQAIGVKVLQEARKKVEESLREHESSFSQKTIINV